MQYKLFTKPSNVDNLDAADCFENVFWVIDGVASHTNTIDSHKDDTFFFVHTLSNNIKQILQQDKNINLLSLLHNSLQQTYNDCLQKGLVLADTHGDHPACALSIIRINNDSLEYYTIADCSLIVLTPQLYPILQLQDNRVTNYEKQYVKEILKVMLNKKCSFREAKQETQEIARKIRHQRNKKNSYWVIDFNIDSLNHGYYGTIPFKQGYILLCSDGFDRLVSLFKLFNYSSLAMFLQFLPVEYFYNLLRQYEEEDSECIWYPRIKVHDDASLIFIEK